MKCQRCLCEAMELTDVEIIADGEKKIIGICNECLDERVWNQVIKQHIRNKDCKE